MRAENMKMQKKIKMMKKKKSFSREKFFYFLRKLSFSQHLVVSWPTLWLLGYSLWTLLHDLDYFTGDLGESLVIFGRKKRSQNCIILISSTELGRRWARALHRIKLARKSRDPKLINSIYSILSQRRSLIFYLQSDLVSFEKVAKIHVI